MQQILGQSRAVDILQTQLASGRLHHAYIFSGPAGVGKFTTAMAFAKALLCHSPERDLAGRVIACGSCKSCRLVDARNEVDQPADARGGADDEPAALGSAHPDLHVVTKELARYSEDRQTRERKLTSIPVDVLRSALIEPVYRAAQLRHNKVFIVDEAELLNPTGQNLLLKTLEEPPAGTTIMLVTSSEHRLLPTIRSRCQRVTFTPLPDEVVQQWVDAHASDWLEQDRRWLVSFAAGSLGRASLAREYELNEWAQTVLGAMERIARGKPTGELGAQLHERIDGFAKAWVDAHKGASKEAANKLASDLMWSLISGHARQRVKEIAATCSADDAAAAEASLEPWLGAIDAVEEAQRLLASNVNLSLTCDHLVSAITRRLYKALV